MNILVCISRTPDTTSKIAFTPDGKDFDTNGITFIMNPYDEWYALVRALELKEVHGGQVTVFHVGEADSDSIIRKALAIGADDAVRVDAVARDAAFVARQVAQFAKDKAFDAIFVGKETIDYNGNQVGAMVAEHLDWPFVSYASSMTSDGQTARITRDVEGGVEEVEVQGSFVLSAAKGLAEQRIPNMRGIMQAKRKPLEVIEAVSCDARIGILEYEAAKASTGVTMIDPEDMDELVRRLHEEARVI